MDLMEILKALFGDEALTFDQFAEKVNNAADVKLGNLAGGQYIEKEKYDDVSKQLETANANLEGYDPDWQTKLAQAQADGEKSSTTTNLSSRLNLQSTTQVQRIWYLSRLILICRRLHRAKTAKSQVLTNSLQSLKQTSLSFSRLQTNLKRNSTSADLQAEQKQSQART